MATTSPTILGKVMKETVEGETLFRKRGWRYAEVEGCYVGYLRNSGGGNDSFAIWGRYPHVGRTSDALIVAEADENGVCKVVNNYDAIRHLLPLATFRALNRLVTRLEALRPQVATEQPQVDELELVTA